MQNLQNTQSLLERAGYLVKESQANLAATGETFNIFAITKIERAEVATHSAMIAELLNPRGSHGKGPVFLAHFLSTIELEHESSLDNAQVRKEQTFGGGRGRVPEVRKKFSKVGLKSTGSCSFQSPPLTIEKLHLPNSLRRN
ncbi:PD-(D/E)XK nuclease family protein [Pseudomonas mohnii]